MLSISLAQGLHLEGEACLHCVLLEVVVSLQCALPIWPLHDPGMETQSTLCHRQYPRQRRLPAWELVVLVVEIWGPVLAAWISGPVVASESEEPMVAEQAAARKQQWRYSIVDLCCRFDSGESEPLVA